MGTSTGTFLAAQDTDITGAVAQKRECFFRNAGKYQFTLLAVRQYFAGLRVDNFCNEMVFVDVHAALFFTFKGNARSRNFGEAINVIGLDAQGLFNVVAHFFGPCFCSEYTCL